MNVNKDSVSKLHCLEYVVPMTVSRTGVCVLMYRCIPHAPRMRRMRASHVSEPYACPTRSYDHYISMRSRREVTLSEICRTHDCLPYRCVRTYVPMYTTRAAHAPNAPHFAGKLCPSMEHAGALFIS